MEARRQRYESFSTDIHFQGTTMEGKKREFSLVINRNLVTNELTIDVARHFTDPEQMKSFEGSEPWTEDELRGQSD